jgi:hypothetical protein
MTDHNQPGTTLCPSTHPHDFDGGKWTCTLPYRHQGNHEAGGVGRSILASWPDAPVQPVTIPEPARAVRIAALHGAGHFLAAHPDLPTPSSVYMNAHGLTPEEIDQIALAHDGVVRTLRSGRRSVEVHLAVETLHGVDITFCGYEELPR